MIYFFVMNMPRSRFVLIALAVAVFLSLAVASFWCLILLAAWYFIVLKLSGNQNVALLCLALLAGDYTILDTASSGRMDTMSAALGFAALAVFLNLRERNFLQSVAFSQTLVALSGLTHPMGILAFLGLLFLTLYFDFRRLSLKIVGVAAIPYLIGGAAFGWWIAQDFEAFRAQFINNALMSGRTGGLSAPLSAIWREFIERYPHAFGLGFNSSGHSGPIYLKSLILLGYVVGLGGILLIKNLRRKYFPLLAVWLVYFVVMALLDGQKETPYLVHVIPFYGAFLAIALNEFWQRKLLPKPLLLAGVALFLALQTGGMALRVRQNTYGNFYRPTVEFLRQNAGASDLIMGEAGLAFGLGFPPNFMSDGRFGYYTGKRPRYLVYDSSVELSWKESKDFAPHLYEHLPRLLEDYQIVYENKAYKIYQRK